VIIKAIIYDFDGPVNDSFREGLRRIKWLCAVNEVRYTREARRKLTELWGIPGAELLQRALDITEILAKKLYSDWEKLDLRDPMPLVPGAKEALFWCRKNGFVNALLTTRNRQNINDIFERLDLHREFEVISAKQDVEYRKPDPRAFRFILEALGERFGVTRNTCIFVGDTIVDFNAGQAAAIETVMVQTGPFLLKQAPKELKLENILRSVDELPEWIMEHHEGEISHDYK